MVLFESINRLADPNTGAGLTGNRRRRIFIPPSTKRPLFSYGEGEDQRSFLSLIENGSEFGSEQDFDDNASVSTSRSLPDSLSSAQATEDQESFHSWLIEEHHRRMSSATSEEDDLEHDHIFGENIYGSGRRRTSVKSGKSYDLENFMNLKTDYVTEIKVLVRHALPLIVTFILEHLFSIVCLIVVGKLGTKELAAVSLATMTSTITFGVFEGAATALDTLCSQAYGAGNFELMGIYVQRSVVFSWVLFIPFAVLWWFSSFILQFIIDDDEVVQLTSLFLRVLIVGAPGYIVFENGKRFLQAQGIFEAGTGILFISAPINICFSWFLVWNKSYGLGYVGAPIATALNFWFMSLMLVLYVRYIDGKKCWYGLAEMSQLLKDWGQFAHLAIPGVVMIESEYLAYEIMTLFASYFGTTALAAQSAVSSIASLSYMVPFAVGIAASTRIAHFIGGQNMDGAIIATRIAMLGALVVASANCLMFLVFKNQLASIFTNDEDVIDLIESLLDPLVAILQVFDGVACVDSGILRAQGLQKVGGVINLIAYYAFALPLALILSKNLGYGLFGLWFGIGSGMVVISLSETCVVVFSDWDQILMQAGLLNDSDEEDDDESV
ncbi:hypothetical protein I9W82_004640 [Candida metapsilosis]|uniref:Uncharacterized protein n=1 Tax=Candida metapsilosis TaxID=273372 RepID=A0A8H8D9D8_9ASCO|nr:hypothetical protein I9W82_004640 [Candida metapsilosis]